MNYETTTLDNGLRIVTHKLDGATTAATGIWVWAGARHENRQISGISHFIEHLIFKGTKKFPGKKLKESIEGVGGTFNGFTSQEFTCYLVKVIDRFFDLSIEVLSDMVLNPQFKKDEMEKERQVLIEEIKMYQDIPMYHVHEILDRLMWPDQPLGMPLTGTIETVSSITLEDLLDFKKEYYSPSAMAVVCCGKVDHEDLVKKIERNFKNSRSKAVKSFSKARVLQEKPKYDFLYKKTEQTHLCMGYHGLNRNHPDRFAQSLLHVILGGNMSSRLFHELREKRGLVYDISTSVKKLQDTGALVVSAGMDNTKCRDAVDIIMRELKKIKKQPVTNSELRRAKDFYSGQLMMALEDNLDYMLWLGENFISTKKLYDPQQILKNVESVRAQDIKRLANDIFKDKDLSLAVIGPLEDREKRKIEEMIRTR